MRTAWEEVDAEGLAHLREITDTETAEIIEPFDRAAPPAPVVPKGWQLVPIEPTQEMIAAGRECANTLTYRSMLKVAPGWSDA